MTARNSAKVRPGETDPWLISEALEILDENTLVEFTPSSAADTSSPTIKFAHDDDYLYVQLSEGIWKRTALSTW